MKFVGSGSLSHSVNSEEKEVFDFEGPIGTLKMEFHLVDQETEEGGSG